MLCLIGLVLTSLKPEGCLSKRAQEREKQIKETLNSPKKKKEFSTDQFRTRGEVSREEKRAQRSGGRSVQANSADQGLPRPASLHRRVTLAMAQTSYGAAGSVPKAFCAVALWWPVKPGSYSRWLSSLLCPVSQGKEFSELP